MNPVKSILLTVLVISISGPTRSQNWMMAKDYSKIAWSNIAVSDQEGKGSLLLYSFRSCTYDNNTQSYTITMADTFHLKSLSASELVDRALNNENVYMIDFYVGLHGGSMVSDEIDGNILIAEVPDLSGQVYIYNAESIDITFSLSCNDQDFYNYSIAKGEYRNFNCNGASVFIKMRSLSGDVVKGEIHYRLEIGHGYKVQYDAQKGIFDVYLDDRVKPTFGSDY